MYIECWRKIQKDSLVAVKRETIDFSKWDSLKLFKTRVYYGEFLPFLGGVSRTNNYSTVPDGSAEM